MAARSRRSARAVARRLLAPPLRPDSNCVRRRCRCDQTPWFDQLVILAILVSSMCLALDSPRVDQESELRMRLEQLDLFFTVLFFCEMMHQVVAMGFA